MCLIAVLAGTILFCYRKLGTFVLACFVISKIYVFYNNMDIMHGQLMFQLYKEQ